MMQHIDVSTVLRTTVACDLYSNLVTRPTGAAVRRQIEALLCTGREADERSLAVIDFSHVRMIDFSCADEVVAKLLLLYCEEEVPPRDDYFIFRGVSEEHLDAIEAVLERHGLALLIEDEVGLRPHGVLADEERAAWELVVRRGHLTAPELSELLGMPADDARHALGTLHRLRLVIRTPTGYAPVQPSYDA